MLLLRIMCLLGLFTVDIKASSHWIVTENGIQMKQDSPFVMERPNDLIAFLNQDTRWHNTFAMYDNLFERQVAINSLWSDLENHSDISTHMIGNENCKKAGEIHNLNWYNTYAEDGKGFGISDDEFKLDSIYEFVDSDVPDCKKISSLTYSMSTFEHLQSVMHRAQLNGTPEITLPSVFSPLWTVNQYGHWLSDTLRKNTSSWLHYNLAAIYWRIKGNVPKALECSRRAVHHAPRIYKSIPLLCMGSILHRIKMTEDAIVVLGAAVDHTPTFSLSHITLGEAYAVVGDFNNSIKHFNMSLKHHPESEEAMKYRSAVLCFDDMFNKILYTQSTLKNLTEELRVYHDIETQWFQTHGAILMNMYHKQEYDFKNVENNCLKMEELTNLKINELQKDRDRNGYIHNLVFDRKYKEDWETRKGISILLTAYDFEKAIKNTSLKAGPPNPNLMDCKSQTPRNKTDYQKDIGPLPVFPDDIYPQVLKYAVPQQTEQKIPAVPPLTIQDHLELAALKKADTGKVMYPSHMKVDRHRLDFDTDKDWPSTTVCLATKERFPEHLESVQPLFLPFENKGLSVKSLLTDRIGVPASVEHELPWHPPLCPTDRDFIVHTNKKPQVKVKVVKEADAIVPLRIKLLTYAGRKKNEKNKQDAEIGHRIHVAIEKKLASKWVVFTLASLYWRVRGNKHNALNCLLNARRTADAKFRDIVLISLSSVFLEMGLWDDSLLTVQEAYEMSPYEPTTNFLLAQLHTVRRQKNAQFFHLKQVLRIEPNYLRGNVRTMLNAWGCLYKHVNTPLVLTDDLDERYLCTQTQPGMSMKCERDGSNCRMTNRDCATPSYVERSFVRRLDLRGSMKNAYQRLHEIQKTTFNKLIQMIPTERNDKSGHQKTFELMIEMFTEQIDSCPTADCEDGEESHVRIEQCISEVFQPNYMFLFTCLPQIFVEEDIEMLTEMSTLEPSVREFPDCEIPLNTDDDFFMTRILVVDTENWSPLFSLMQHFSVTYQQYDFLTMGSIIARYLEINPLSWRAAAMAGWWCGAGGRGDCAARCAAVAHALAPPADAHIALRPLIAALQMQSKTADAMEIAYLSFYTAPKSVEEAVILGFTHFYRGNVKEAVWLFRYALVFNSDNVSAMTAQHIVRCERIFGKNYRKTQTTN